MDYYHQFFKALDIDPSDARRIKAFAKETEVPVARLRSYDKRNILPTGGDLARILSVVGISEIQLKLKMGILDRKLLDKLAAKSDVIADLIGQESEGSQTCRRDDPEPALRTNQGRLYQDDCLNVLATIEADSIDLVFADPPFNLNKEYPSEIDDSIREADYLRWCESWLDECIRVLKPGGSLFLWNLPKWNIEFGRFLNDRLRFRHWIAVDIKYRLPIAGRLYPSHYSLLYFTKGETPAVFQPDRLPMEVCPECQADLKDYGGYKNKMNPLGINLTDVWYDIPPVRHQKYKGRNGANELSIKLMDRIIEMASDEGDLVFDPFGGAGTTYIVAEMKNRRWLGAEIGPVNDIINRFERIDQEREYLERIRSGYNALFTEDTLSKRRKRGLWTHTTYMVSEAAESSQLRLLEKQRSYDKE